MDYIVKNTVGNFLEGKTPRQAASLRILDPACGSGSFLIGAYQYLLDWHRDWYVRDGPEKWATGKAPAVYQAAGGDWRLTTAERKRILLNNIYGVDIDPQAVEVTKLSLSLKVLEGESAQSVGTQLRLFQERALPDLAANIKCGNSLIAPDYFGTQLSLSGEGERYLINAFDWRTEFASIMRAGGFDAVIGNPPYGGSASPEQIAYYRRHYSSAATSCDSFGLFIEQSSSVLRPAGLFGMIVQSAWVSSPSFASLRELFVSRFRPAAFATMPYDVFNAYVDTVVVIAERLPGGKTLRGLSQAPVRLVVFPPRHRILSLEEFESYSKQADATRWVSGGRNQFAVTLSDREHAIIERVKACGAKFSDVADIQRGVTPFHVSSQPPSVSACAAFDGTVRRCRLQRGQPAFIRYDETLAEYKPPRYFRGPRLLLRELISRQFRLQAVFVDEDFVTNKSMQSLLLAAPQYDILYLSGLLNSRLLSWYFLSMQSVGRRDDFPKIVLKQTRELPFRAIDSQDAAEKAQHDRMVFLVGQMLALHRDADAARAATDKAMLQRHIEARDRDIDRLAHELYGLTEEQARVVDGRSDRRTATSE